METDEEYLERLGLLTPMELGILQAKRRDAAEAAAERERWYAEYDAKRGRGVLLVPTQAAQSSEHRPLLVPRDAS